MSGKLHKIEKKCARAAVPFGCGDSRTMFQNFKQLTGHNISHVFVLLRNPIFRPQKSENWGFPRGLRPILGLDSASLHKFAPERDGQIENRPHLGVIRTSTETRNLTDADKS